MAHLLLRAADAVLSCLTPPRCRSCRAPLFNHANPFLCDNCREKIQWIGDGACRRCGFPAGPFATLGRACGRCRGRDLRLTATASVARYRGSAMHLVKAFKYGGDTELARPLAGMMAERWRGMEFALKVDMAVPVAMHAPRRRRRGFDQAGLLAERVARELGLPCAPALRRLRETRPQAALLRHDRLENMAGVFSAREDLVTGRSILFVDDVMTTGATLADGARALREAGAKHVYALVFAR